MQKVEKCWMSRLRPEECRSRSPTRDFHGSYDSEREAGPGAQDWLIRVPRLRFACLVLQPAGACGNADCRRSRNVPGGSNRERCDRADLRARPTLRYGARLERSVLAECPVW